MIFDKKKKSLSGFCCQLSNLIYLFFHLANQFFAFRFSWVEYLFLFLVFGPIPWFILIIDLIDLIEYILFFLFSFWCCFRLDLLTVKSIQQINVSESFEYFITLGVRCLDCILVAINLTQNDLKVNLQVKLVIVTSETQV